MEYRTKIQVEREKRRAKMARLFAKYREKVSKTRAAELVAVEIGCSRSSVINALTEREEWK